jgi:hypothetical protein
MNNQLGKWHCSDCSITRQVIFVLGVVSLCLLLLSGCSPQRTLLGRWQAADGSAIVFQSDGTVTTSGALHDAVGSYQLIVKTHLEITLQGGDAPVGPQTLSFQRTGQQLMLTDEMSVTIELQRVP